MFTGFFYALRSRNVPVSMTEWMTFIEALSRGYIQNLDDFYYLGRATLVKSEGYFDHYDVAFQEYFRGIETPAELLDQVLEWLKGSLEGRALTEEQRAMMKLYDFEELMRELEKRLKEQTGQHDGGGHWIGRGGYSPFGHSGQHPAGIRIGGQSGHRSAVKIAAERRFRNYRSDLTLDTRQMKLALKRLRHLGRIGPADELDLDETIKTTAKNAGDIDLIWRRSRKNTVKLLLLMDVGGSMEPFAQLVSQLFSAAHSSSHFKDFQYYYFHNCIYDNLYRDIERQDRVSTEHLLRTLEPNYRVVLVGDARMGPWELSEKYGAIDYYERNELPGALWLKRISEHFRRCVWLNPEEAQLWYAYTVRVIGKIFPMYPLTLDGLHEAVRRLSLKQPQSSVRSAAPTLA